MLWKLEPEIKVLVGDADFPFHKHSYATDVYLVENAIARVGITAADDQAKNYLRRTRFLDTVDVQLRYADENEGWTTVFGGNVEDLNPVLSLQGPTLLLSCYGYGRSLRLTHCGEDYGVESENTTIDTPSEIITDVADNRVEKDFDGDATGFTFDGTTKVKSLTNPSITHLMGGYRKNIDILNETLLNYQAYQAGSAGVHWRVDPSKQLWVDTIASHSVDTDVWPTYWNWGATESTLKQKRDILQLSLGTIGRNYANKILLCTDFRRPGYDYWTENQKALWGSTAVGIGVNVQLTDDNGAGNYVVGSYSLLIEGQNGGTVHAYYPSAENAAWDFTKCGSSRNPPSLNFYYKFDDLMDKTQLSVRLFTTDHDTDYFWIIFSTWTSDVHSTWYHRSFPIGPYWKTSDELRQFRWGTNGNPDWANINGVSFKFHPDAGAAWTSLWIDDLHFTGKLVREAEDTSEMSDRNQHQKIVKMDTSVSDTLKASDDSGTAGRLAYAELLRSVTLPVRGTVRVPLCPQMLPGQLAPIKYGLKANGNYQIDDTFRIQQVHHHFGDDGIYTELTVTDDLINTFAYGPSEALSSLAKALYVDPEAKSLKTTGIDTLVARLTKPY